MAVDPYSFCPGGTGEKIKFCCPDLVTELDRIERMLEGEQYQACLDLVVRLEEKHKGRACLLAAKGLLLRSLNRLEDALANATEFANRHPENPIAWAELAMTRAIFEGGRAAMEALQKALALSGERLLPAVYQMLGLVERVLAAENDYLAARAVCMLQAMLNQRDVRARLALAELNSTPHVPLWVKQLDYLVPCPDGASWKPEFEAGRLMALRGQWSAAGATFSALAEKVGDLPAIWYNILLARAFAADAAGCADAARKYASLDLPLDDAAEIEAVALFFSEDALGDSTGLYRLEYPVVDIDAMEIALTSDRRVGTMRVDPASWQGEPPPPRAGYVFLDRAPPDLSADLTVEKMPLVIGQAFLFGRQTDREPRLVIEDVSADSLGTLKELLNEVCGRHLGPIDIEQIEVRVSRTALLLRQQWLSPPGMTRAQFRQLATQYHHDFLLHQWPKMPLGALDGKTAEEAAAADHGLRRRVLGAVLLLEFWLERFEIPFDSNELRVHLGLPTRDPIDPETTPPESIPLARLDRLMVEKLTDEQLFAAFRRAVVFGAASASRKLALAVVDRPSSVGRPERIAALGRAASEEQLRSPEKSLAYLDEGRRASIAAGNSCAQWDLLEFSLLLRIGQADAAERMYRHLERQHLDEPGVAESLARLFMDMGLWHPDGTPVAPAPQPADKPAIVVPGGGEADKLWTPDSAAPAGETPSLCTPGG
jgi:tetratricopeptide (TPR) repeat protein